VVDTDASRSTAPEVPPYRRPRLLVVGLSVVVLTVAVQQTAVVPVLGIIVTQLGASAVAVSWAVTANLLAAAAATQRTCRSRRGNRRRQGGEHRWCPYLLKPQSAHGPTAISTPAESSWRAARADRPHQNAEDNARTINLVRFS